MKYSRSFTTQTEINVDVSASGVLAIDGVTFALTHSDMGRLASALDEMRKTRAHELRHGRMEPYDGESI